MARHTYTSALEYMGLPIREMIRFWQALINVLDREAEAREEARND